MRKNPLLSFLFFALLFCLIGDGLSQFNKLSQSEKNPTEEAQSDNSKTESDSKKQEKQAQTLDILSSNASFSFLLAKPFSSSKILFPKLSKTTFTIFQGFRQEAIALFRKHFFKTILTRINPKQAP